MKSGPDEAARGSIPGSSPRPDREHRNPQPTTCYTVACVKTAVEISEESPANTQVIFGQPLTGWGQEGNRARSQDAGCDGHLVKPVNLSDLETLLAELKSRDNSK